jgi:hypothetical protein
MGIRASYGTSLSNRGLFNEITAFMNEMLESWGFKAVIWDDRPTQQILDEGIAAGYERQTGTVHLDGTFR